MTRWSDTLRRVALFAAAPHIDFRDSLPDDATLAGPHPGVARVGPRRHSSPRVILFRSVRGGSGTTNLVFQVSAALAADGWRVVCVDASDAALATALTGDDRPTGMGTHRARDVVGAGVQVVVTGTSRLRHLLRGQLDTDYVLVDAGSVFTAGLEDLDGVDLEVLVTPQPYLAERSTLRTPAGELYATASSAVTSYLDAYEDTVGALKDGNLDEKEEAIAAADACMEAEYGAAWGEHRRTWAGYQRWSSLTTPTGGTSVVLMATCSTGCRLLRCHNGSTPAGSESSQRCRCCRQSRPGSIVTRPSRPSRSITWRRSRRRLRRPGTPVRVPSGMSAGSRRASGGSPPASFTRTVMFCSSGLTS